MKNSHAVFGPGDLPSEWETELAACPTPAEIVSPKERGGKRRKEKKKNNHPAEFALYLAATTC